MMTENTVWCVGAGSGYPELIKESFEIGLRVVRLHTGDPSQYGAIFEQMVLLDEARIPFEIIPGVTAAFATAAALNMADDGGSVFSNLYDKDYRHGHRK